MKISQCDIFFHENSQHENLPVYSNNSFIKCYPIGACDSVYRDNFFSIHRYTCTIVCLVLVSLVTTEYTYSIVIIDNGIHGND